MLCGLYYILDHKVQSFSLPFILILLTVSKWSPDDVADWLTNIVHLPHHAEVFKNKQIDGHHLPRYM
jgi:hypothetical protein